MALLLVAVTSSRVFETEGKSWQMSPDVVWVEIEHITLTAVIPARLMSESVFKIVVNKERNDVRGSAPVEATSFTGLPSLPSMNFWRLQTCCHETSQTEYKTGNHGSMEKNMICCFCSCFFFHTWNVVQLLVVAPVAQFKTCGQIRSLFQLLHILGWSLLSAYILDFFFWGQGGKNWKIILVLLLHSWMRVR